MNTLFRIAFGDYEFVLDRTRLTYSLTETVTKTVWATELSLGWIELKERETGVITRTDFGDCKLISIAEKMGAAGKRILLGLDAPGGVPIDIYLICGPKEIQLTVEASRDSKTHLLERVGLVPGLCHAEQDGYLVLPLGGGRLLSSESEFYGKLPVWNPLSGLLMPFIGAIKPTSAIALLTDSAYALAEIPHRMTGSLVADWIYERDSERRRLDLRIVLLPQGDYIAIARAYRDKLIAERNHITLRKKFREKPEIEALLGKVLQFPESAIELDFILPNEQRWEFLEQKLQKETDNLPVVTMAGDWAYLITDVLILKYAPAFGIPIPLLSVIYRDSVLIPYVEASLSSILHLAPMLLLLTPENLQMRLLAQLHSLTFPAFLTRHKFLTPDFLVEEALYSDKTYVLINQSETVSYDAGEFLLPPGGFYVHHPQFEAHDALRVRTVEFPTCAWRIRRSLDGKPLEQSEQIEEREFEVF